MVDRIKLRFEDEEVRTYDLVAEGELFWIVTDPREGDTMKVYKDEAERVELE